MQLGAITYNIINNVYKKLEFIYFEFCFSD